MKIKNISDIIFVKELDLEVRLYTTPPSQKNPTPSCLISLLFWGGGVGVFFIPCSKCCLCVAPKVIYANHFAVLFGQLQCIYK